MQRDVVPGMPSDPTETFSTGAPGDVSLTSLKNTGKSFEEYRGEGGWNGTRLGAI